MSEGSTREQRKALRGSDKTSKRRVFRRTCAKQGPERYLGHFYSSDLSLHHWSNLSASIALVSINRKGVRSLRLSHCSRRPGMSLAMAGSSCILWYCSIVPNSPFDHILQPSPSPRSRRLYDAMTLSSSLFRCSSCWLPLLVSAPDQQQY